MIFMYHGGYYYDDTHRGVVGTVCFDTTTNKLVSVGQTSTTTVQFPPAPAITTI